jgi:hypothetical protein
MAVRPLSSIHTPEAISYGSGSEIDTDVQASQGNITCDADKSGSIEGRYLLAGCEVAGLVATVLIHTLWLIVSYKSPSWYGWTTRLALVSAVRLSYPIIKLASLITTKALDSHALTCPCEAVGMLLWVPIRLNGNVFASVDSMTISLIMLAYWCIGYQVRRRSNATRL